MYGHKLPGLFHSGPSQQSLAYFSAGLDFCFFCRVPTSEAELGGQAKEEKILFQVRKNQYLHLEMTNQFKYKFSCCPCGIS